VIFRRRASPLHAARAAAGAAYCAALAACALTFQHPLILAAVALAALGAGVGAGVSRELLAAARFTIPLASLIAIVNPFVVHDGLTVFFRLGEVTPFGQVDLTVEALVYGLLLGARVVAVALCCALFVAAVDPDETLRLFRRISFRSALTAALAARLMPVVARDARRMADASACRPGAPPGRVAVMRAVATSALDHAFAAAAAALAALALVARAAGVAAFTAYPSVRAPVGAGEAALAVALLVVALAPFLDRRGIER
jgi:energy-coupling factor transport system permease protein